MTWPTAGSVLTRAAVRLGLATGTSAVDPNTSTDKNIQLLGWLMTDVGLRLARQHNWSQLRLAGSFTTAAGVSDYALPLGFARFADGSMWNETQGHQPVSASPQQWVALRATDSGGVVQKAVRIAGRTLSLYETPTAVETFGFEYQTRYWVAEAVAAWAALTVYTAGAVRRNGGLVYTCTTGGTSAASGGPTGTASSITDGTVVWAYSYPNTEAVPPASESWTDTTDYVLYDLLLMTDALCLEFRRNKGLDTTTEQQTYDATLAAVLGGDGLGPTLSLTPRRSGGLLGVGNAPDRGYG